MSRMRLWHKNSLRRRLIIYFMAIIIIMSALNIFPYYSISVLMNKMSSTFELNVQLNQLNNTLEQLDYAYESYLETKHSKSLDDYYRYSNDLREKANEIQVDNSSMENVLVMKDIRNMISNYLDEMDDAVKARRSRMVDDYLNHYSESTKLHQYIVEYIQKLNNNMLYQNTDRYVSVSKSIRLVQTLNIGVIFSIFTLSIALILWFTYRITKPIFELSRAADEIAHGNFNVPSVKVNSNDEIGIMAVAFNRMTESIRQYINEINEKAGLERRLQEKEMENLIMKTNLREAELHALQSQINPHFLFNTLNVGAQLAMMEGADLDRKIPCMILQPIVENAYIHGISDVEYMGKISLSAHRRDGFAVISIKDNGKGMSEDKICEILSGDKIEKLDVDNRHEGHTNGIGLNNIISRLKIFYSQEEIFNIYSDPGQGTEVVLHIPMES